MMGLPTGIASLSSVKIQFHTKVSVRRETAVLNSRRENSKSIVL
jgi:hypothetical protein